MVAQEDLWLCRDELTGVDARIEGWDIRGRWFGVVVGTTPRTGDLRGGETVPWRVIECANSAACGDLPRGSNSCFGSRHGRGFGNRGQHWI